ncbi:OmpP1/FadL family transporter [Tenacibaculum salmonis]|uniref:OmpP1/FadL family transporter n=1 Tax=Tenacibaculum sp. P3-BQ1 TaxID=3232310 RepID=UPI0034DF4106
MKRLLTFAVIIASTTYTFSQSLNYTDLGILFSQNENYGTARFEAMAGAFGALGGDVSSININPAGGAVARKNLVSITLGNRNTDTSINYYGETFNNQDNFFNLTQAGAILSFDTAYDSDWNRFALSFNYSIKKDFNNSYLLNNGEYLKYSEHQNDEKINKTAFLNSVEHKYSNSFGGQTAIYNFGFSAVHLNKFFVGAALNIHDLNFTQTTHLNEVNQDNKGNTLKAYNLTSSQMQGNGFSLSLGFIYKVNRNFRFGLAYESPAWYEEVIENYKDRLTMNGIKNLDLDSYYDLINDYPNSFRFKSPGRITASGAIIFGKKGLVSFDYTYKDFRNIKYQETDQTLLQANQSFSNTLRSTQALNVGTEWRFDKMSIRGGYHYEKNPNLLTAFGGNTNKDNLRGFTLGLGYNFGKTKFDLSYRKSENMDYYTLNNSGDTEVNNNSSRVSATLTFNL